MLSNHTPPELRSDTERVRVVYDTEYTPEGSFAYDTPEETARAEREERADLESGEYVAVGVIVETACSTCGTWEHSDSVWGCVTKNDARGALAIAREFGL